MSYLILDQCAPWNGAAATLTSAMEREKKGFVFSPCWKYWKRWNLELVTAAACRVSALQKQARLICCRFSIQGDTYQYPDLSAKILSFSPVMRGGWLEGPQWEEISIFGAIHILLSKFPRISLVFRIGSLQNRGIQSHLKNWSRKKLTFWN